MNDEAAQGTARTARLAVWSLVLAIAGLVLIGPLGGIPAVICGHIAVRRIKRSSGTLRGRGLAIAGLVVGYTAFVVNPIVLLSPPFFCVCGGPSAERILGANNLKQIGVAARMYAADNGGVFPSDLRSCARPPYLSAGQRYLFISPITGHEPGELSEVDQWSDYVLVPGRKESDPRNTVLGFSKPECYPGEGGNVLFVTGKVRWCDLEEYQRLTAGLIH